VTRPTQDWRTLTVGEDFGPYTYEVSASRVRAYGDMTGDHEGDLVPCAVPIAEYFFVGIDPTGRRGHPGRAGRTRAGRRPRRGARSRRRASVRHVRVAGDGLNGPPGVPGVTICLSTGPPVASSHTPCEDGPRAGGRTTPSASKEDVPCIETSSTKLRIQLRSSR
jgi:hypothetical protein